MATLAHSLAPARTRSAPYNLALVLAGSLLIAGLAQLYIRLPFTPVPVTGQTLGVLLVGASLGPLRGTSSVLLYLAWGAMGLPFFAEGEAGVQFLLASAPTAGYLWGFVAAAYVVGALAKKGWDRKPSTAIGAMLIGEIVIFTFGVGWLATFSVIPGLGHIGLDKALEFGLYPFVIGDLAKLLIAAGLMPAAWRLFGDRSQA